MTTLRSCIHTESTLAACFVDSCELLHVPLPFWHKLRSFEYFVSWSTAISGRTPSITASLQGLEDLRESLVEFAREQVLEDFAVERLPSISSRAWQKRQSRQISRAVLRVQLCESPGEVVN